MLFRKLILGLAALVSTVTAFPWRKDTKYFREYSLPFYGVRCVLTGTVR